MTPHPADQALQLFRDGRIAEALPQLAEAHSRDPSDLRVLHAYASATRQNGQPDAAVAIYRRAVQAMPEHPGLLSGLGHALVSTGARVEAMPFLQRALELNPRDIVAGGYLGMLLCESDQPDAACAVLEPLVAFHPTNAGLVWEFARALWAADRMDDSERQFETHRALQPRYSRNRVALGRLAVSRGEIERARALFREALGIDPDDAAAWWELAHADPDGLDEQAIQRIATLAVTAHYPEQRELFEDILARHDDRNARFVQAAAHAAIANNLRIGVDRTRRPAYDPAAHVRENDTTIATYKPSLFVRNAAAGMQSSKPVFVIGLPRSGTTLLERMLAAHPQVAGIGEQRLARESLQRALPDARTDVSHMAKPVIADAADWLLAALERRVRLLSPHARAERIVDKLPDNYLLAGWIALTFPHATIIHCQRDPRDVALSCWLGRLEIPWSHDIASIAARIEQHRRLMRHWRATLPQPPLDVAYEDLVVRPRDILEGVLARMQLDWSDDVLAFARSEGTVKSASQMQVREPLNTRGIGRWKNYTGVLDPVMERLDAIVANDRDEGLAPRFFEAHAAP